MRMFAIVLALAFSSCAAPIPAFDGERAFADLAYQVEFGPRIPGTDGHRQCAAWIQEQLRPLADSLWKQDFTGTVLGSPDTFAMTNIVARFNPSASTRIVIGAHWDTRPLADLDPDSTKWDEPVPGANDGASGVAVLLELARILDSVAPPIGVDLVFFDGEDGGDYGVSPGHWCQGSFHFAAHLPTRYDRAVVVDMVGDKNLRLPVEGNSFRLSPDWVDRIWKTAAELNVTAFERVRGEDVFDDHMPLLMKGIPAVDIIDFDYVHWHTTNDTIDKCSAASLAVVGQVLTAVIYDF